MENNFWTYFAIPFLVALIVLLLEYFIIQPLAKGLEKNKYNKNTPSRSTKRYFFNAVFGKIISRLATISPKFVILSVIFFLFGFAFTILIARMTNTNLATIGVSAPKAPIGVSTPEDRMSQMCDNNGIVGQVVRDVYYGKIGGVKGATVTTSPSTSSVVTDEQGYFWICDIPVGDEGQEYTVVASAKIYASPISTGSVVVTVFPNRKSIAVITVQP